MRGFPRYLAPTVLLGLIIGGCAQGHVQWVRASWSTVPVEAANARCQYETTALSPLQGGGLLYQIAAQNNLFTRCMAAQGWNQVFVPAAASGQVFRAADPAPTSTATNCSYSGGRTWASAEWCKNGLGGSPD